MTKEYLQEVFSYLDEQNKKHYCARNRQMEGIIENHVRSYANSFDDDLYLILSKERATGLFRHGFFRSDLERSLRIIENMLKK